VINLLLKDIQEIPKLTPSKIFDQIHQEFVLAFEATQKWMNRLDELRDTGILNSLHHNFR